MPGKVPKKRRQPGGLQKNGVALPLAEDAPEIQIAGGDP
jgi:hypothetical protein